ncbi:hypothetical protein MTO96_001272 [Rhipicephalus appendiculatus]
MERDAESTKRRVKGTRQMERAAGERRRRRQTAAQEGGLVVRVTSAARLALSAPQARLGLSGSRCLPAMKPKGGHIVVAAAAPIQREITSARIWAPGRDDALPRTCGTC